MLQPFGIKLKLSVCIVISLVFGIATLSRAYGLPLTPGLWDKDGASKLFQGQRAVKSSLRGLVLDQDGKAIEGARLIIEGVSSAATSQDGTFTLSGLAEGVSYNVFIQRAGFSFTPAVITAQAQDSLTFRGESLGGTAPDCSEVVVSPLLVVGANSAARLYSETLTLSRKLPPNQPLRLLSGELIRGKDLPKRVEEQYANFQFYSRYIPEVDIQCGEGSACIALDVREAKLFMEIELDNLSHERLLTNRVLRKRGKIRNVQSTSVKRNIISMRNDAKARLERIGNLVGTCY